MRRIPGKDAMFLWAETPTTHMTIAFVGVFDPSTLDGSVEPGEVFDRFRTLMEERIHLIPQFRQRVVNVPFGLDNPYLVDDPHFDLGYHLRRIALPAPGDMALLEEFVGRLVSRPLDMTKPLWEIYLVEGLEGGRWAYVGKAHHVLVDGVGGNEMLVQLLDLSPESREVDPPEEPWEPAALPTDLELLGRAAVGTARKPGRFFTTVRRTTDVAIDLARSGIQRRHEEPWLSVQGPRTFLNGPLGPHRQVSLGQFSLADVKQAKSALGCTVNDVILAITGRALRRFTLAHDQRVDRGMVAAVPISVRPQDGEGAMDNQVAGMTVPLHDDVDDVQEQLRLIARSTKPAKEQLGAVTATLLQDWTEYAVPAVAAQAIRFYSRAGLARRHPPVANVTLSNVPGPPVPLYLAGSQMLAMYPIGPVIHNQRVNITVVSYLDTMFLGVVADRDAVPSTDELVAHFTEAVGEVLEGAEKAAVGSSG